MGLKDLARGAGNVANKRRGGNNSALAQRYLAAIDGDAIELVLPSQQYERQRQPISPSGRSRSSHTTKSTKQTVRTVGGESSDSAWNETPTPSSPSRYRRRPLHPEQPQSVRPEISNASSEQRSNSAGAAVAPKTSTPDRANVPASKRGFFPRTVLQNVSSPPPKPEITRAAYSLPKSSGTKPRQLRSTNIRERCRVLNNKDDYESDDGDSSLTSRRTSESKDPPNLSPRGLVHNHPLHDHFDDNTASSDESSLSYDDKEKKVQPHPLQQDYRFYSERKHVSAVPRKQTQFSIEKTFDQAFGKGLDMILNTNAWACTVPESRPSATSPIPSSTRDTKRISGRSQQNTVMTPPQRRKQRYNALRHSLSAETPKSDVTGAETEIATNRAIDLALRRVREIENGISLSKGHVMRPPEQTKSKATNHVKQVAMNFERGKIEEVTPPLLVCNRINGGSQQLVKTKTMTNQHAVVNGKLNCHILESKVHNSSIGRADDEHSQEHTRSLSSSVGVEIGGRFSRPENKVSTALDSSVQTNEVDVLSSLDKQRNYDSSKYRGWNRYNTRNVNVPDCSAEHLQTLSINDVKDSTPTRPLLTGRSPVSENYVSLDPCMSPPRIVRKAQSFDETSPDPIFCSKSMSMSIHSSQIFSHSPSTNTSGDVSFQSDDAMFMEKAEESLSSNISDAKQKQIGSADRAYSIEKSPNVIEQSKDMKNPEVSGHTAATLATHSDDETSHDQEHSSPYLELLGIRGSFPSTPLIERPKSSLLHLSRRSDVVEPHSPPLGRFSSPTPLLIEDNVSRESRADMTVANDFAIRMGNSGSNSVKPRHSTIAKPHPVRTQPHIDFLFHGDTGVKSSRFSLNNALAAKLSRTNVPSHDGNADVRSVDVKSIRSAFESILSPHDALDEKGEEDTASVKSLREHFEPPAVSMPCENGIAKTRALFEKKRVDACSFKEVASGKMVVMERVGLHRSHEVNRAIASKSKPIMNSEENDEEFRSLNEVLVDSSFERKPFSVADRIRAFGGGQKSISNAKSWKTPVSKNKSAIGNGTVLPEQRTHEVSPIELSGAVKVSPTRRRMSNFRALGGKAFLCGPSKDLFATSDGDGILKPSIASVQPQDFIKVSSTENPKQIDSESSHIQSLEVDHDEVSEQPRLSRSQIVEPKPMWMQQREKILSKSGKPGQPRRVLTASIESKRETSFLRHENGTKLDMSTLDLCQKISSDGIASDVCHQPCETSEVGGQSSNFVVDQGKIISKDFIKSAAIPKPVVETETSEYVLAANKSDGLENETIDQYFANPLPAYKFCRSSSENAKSVSKKSSLLFSIDLGCLEETETKHLDLGQVGLFDVSDEKKEEIISDDYFVRSLGESPGHESVDASLSKTSNNFSRNLRNRGFETGLTGHPQVTDENGPFVVKPVARKPYVRPVPIKPIVDSLPVLPFVRSVSDPTARKFSSKTLSHYSQMFEDETRFLSKAVIDRKYATLALPRLADTAIESREIYNDMDCCSENSEFSDGVTLDLSIADVSNLTNPTAIVSKLGGKDNDGNQSESSEYSYPTTKNINEKMNRDVIDVEAKQSEASSSQTSEAAAPLLARAMRTFPLSDEASSDSFFKKRILVAKQQWSSRLNSKRLESETANAKEDDSLFNDDLGGIWDIRQVESLFPISSPTIPYHSERISALDDWQPFSPTVDEAETPRNFHDISDPENSTSISRSKTPTRRNTSRIAHPPPSPPQRPESDISHVSRNFQFMTESSTAPLGSDVSYPMLSTGSSSENARTSRTVVSQLLSSALSGSTNSTSFNYNNNTTNTVSNKSTASSSTVSNLGPMHSALLARIHSLKESRLRRATRIGAPQSNITPMSTPLVNQASTLPAGYYFNRSNGLADKSLSNGSVQSSTQFGGHKFVACLDVD